MCAHGSKERWGRVCERRKAYDKIYEKVILERKLEDKETTVQRCVVYFMLSALDLLRMYNMFNAFMIIFLRGKEKKTRVPPYERIFFRFVYINVCVCVSSSTCFVSVVTCLLCCFYRGFSLFFLTLVKVDKMSGVLCNIVFVSLMVS